MGLSLVAMTGDYSLVEAHGLFIVAASLVSEKLVSGSMAPSLQ